jgi:NAD(P)-dependent dehydrogenase (short-subunit alcohol dehydrogenase family)
MQGKVAIVTGAAGGLGRATALRLARAGADLCLVDIDREGLERSGREAAELGAETLLQPLDLAQRANCFAVVEAARTRFGRLDALCNIAAVFIPCHAGEMSEEQWNATLAVNLSAPFHLIQGAIPHLLESAGAVVNVTSCAAFTGQAYTAAYCATKAGLTHMTRALAMEYMNRKIRFNAVAPGGMLTALAMGFRELRDPEPELIGRYSPLRGMVEIDDVAEMVAFLASDAARGYHGACINIDNGITAG